MKRRVIIDTGPLVAFINRKEHLHSWVINTLATIEQPLLTCEPVIVETCFLLRNIDGGQDTVMSLLDQGNILISMCLSEEGLLCFTCRRINPSVNNENFRCSLSTSYFTLSKLK